MAKLYYGPDYATISVRADDDTSGMEREIEVTAEQALALAASQIGLALGSLIEAVNDISSAIGSVAQATEDATGKGNG
jgi:hypothetical protein